MSASGRYSSNCPGFDFSTIFKGSLLCRKLSIFPLNSPKDVEGEYEYPSKIGSILAMTSGEDTEILSLSTLPFIWAVTCLVNSKSSGFSIAIM